MDEVEVNPEWDDETRSRFEYNNGCIMCGCQIKIIGFQTKCPYCFENELEELGVQFDRKALKAAPLLKRHGWGDEKPVRVSDLDAAEKEVRLEARRIAAVRLNELLDGLGKGENRD